MPIRSSERNSSSACCLVTDMVGNHFIALDRQAKLPESPKVPNIAEIDLILSAQFGFFGNFGTSGNSDFGDLAHAAFDPFTSGITGLCSRLRFRTHSRAATPPSTARAIRIHRAGR